MADRKRAKNLELCHPSFAAGVLPVARIGVRPGQRYESDDNKPKQALASKNHVCQVPGKSLNIGDNTRLVFQAISCSSYDVLILFRPLARGIPVLLLNQVVKYLASVKPPMAAMLSIGIEVEESSPAPA